MNYSRQHTSADRISSAERFFGLALILIAASLSLVQAKEAVALPIIPAGIEYFHQRIGEGPLSVHWAKIDRSQSQFAFESSLAKRTIYDLEPLAEQVGRVGGGRGKPLVAVNGDFFRIRSGPYQGDPLGLQIVGGELVSSPKNTCFWIDLNGGPRIGYVHPAFTASRGDGSVVKFELNQECSADIAVLYSPAMGASTRTEKMLEFVVEGIEGSGWLPIKAGGTFKGRVASVSREGNSAIDANNVVLAVGSKLARKVESVRVGDVLSFSFKTTPDLTGVHTAIGGGPVLISEEKVQQFTGHQPRHPRTAIGWNETHFFMLVVDGRQLGLSIGMSFPELADFLLKLGCKEAMNLDGGGSSTFWLDGKIMNSPSDRRQRAVANGLILLQKQGR